jgi:hypothetical protein
MAVDACKESSFARNAIKIYVISTLYLYRNYVTISRQLLHGRHRQVDIPACTPGQLLYKQTYNINTHC